MRAVFRKELRALFGGLTGWGTMALLLAAAGASVFFINVRGSSPLFCDNARYIALGMALSCGLLCADAYPAERRQRTERALYALPITSRGIFAGKLLARLTVLLAGCALLALYPVVLSVAVPSAALAEGLGSVLALCAMGVMFTAAALCCSALSRSAIVAFVAYAALVALAWFAPDIAGRVAGMSALSPVTLALLPALAGMLIWLITNDVLAGFIAAAVVLAPVLFNHLRANDGAVFGGIARGLRACAVFEPLTLTANGILDLSALIYWLSAAVVLAAAGMLAAVARRQGKRRAL